MALCACPGVVALGCQGEDDEAPTRADPGGAAERRTPARARPALTRSRFVRRANALCTDAKRRAAPISDAVAARIAAEDAAGVARELRKALPIAKELLERLRALAPPIADEALVRRYLDLMAEQKEQLRPLTEALEAEDISTVEVLVAELREGNRAARRVGRRYGLTQCDPGGLPAAR